MRDTIKRQKIAARRNNNDDYAWWSAPVSPYQRLLDEISRGRGGDEGAGHHATITRKDEQMKMYRMGPIRGVVYPWQCCLRSSRSSSTLNAC